MAGIQGFNSFNYNLRDSAKANSLGAPKSADAEAVIADGFVLANTDASQSYSPLTHNCTSLAAETLGFKVDQEKVAEVPARIGAGPADSSTPAAHTPSFSSLVERNFAAMGILSMSQTQSVSDSQAPRGSSLGVDMNSVGSSFFFGLNGQKLAG